MNIKKMLSGLVLLVVTSSAMAQGSLKSLENISQELVDIRQQIEALHNQINYEKETYRDQMRSYSNQKSDLDVRISRAELNIKDLQRELKKLADISKEKNQSEADITPILKEAIADIRTSVASSLPFKLSQRLDALNDIEHRLDTYLISPNKAANQLWAYVEDELVLGKSSGLYKDTVEVDGQEKLVKVLRIGKVAMFYKGSDDNYGVIRKQGGQWVRQTIADQEEVAELDQLFDAFAKNIHNGQFTIPNFLPRS